MYTTYQTTEQQATNVYYEAERRVNAKIRFYRCLVSYVFVNTLIFLIWLSTQGYDVDFGNDFHIYGWNYPWFLWVMVPWGIALIARFLTVFIFPGRYNRQQMLENEMPKLGVKPHSYPAYTDYPVPTPQQEQK